ncbi:hypothetical protein IH879_06600 [candidate division KSB1 bacterium]|nr:hypothetical protein [candidate division KSB1 bacterium]
MLKLILTLSFLGFLNSNSLAEKGQTASEILTNSLIENNSRFEFFKNFQPQAQNSPPQNGAKSVPKALLFSAVVPGSGQIYSRSYLKGLAFLVIEAAALTGHFRFNSRGDLLEDQFEADANALWDENAYWNWMEEICGGSCNNMDDLRSFERANFSHFLPEEKNQPYYENIGKYNQFIIGWQEFREEILPEEIGEEPFTYAHYQSGELNGKDLRTISPQRTSYTELQDDSDRNFKRATTLASLLLLNHVVSALDAAWTTKRFNRRVQAGLSVRQQIYQTEIIPVLRLGVTW